MEDAHVEYCDMALTVVRVTNWNTHYVILVDFIQTLKCLRLAESVTATTLAKFAHGLYEHQPEDAIIAAVRGEPRRSSRDTT